MGRAPLHALIWSAEQRLYEWYTRGQFVQRFQPAEAEPWLAWLASVSSFAFHGARGDLNVYLEQRPRGGTYWYAYQTKEGRTRKRYLGQTHNLTLSLLERTAQTLVPEVPSASGQQMPVLSAQNRFPRLPHALVARDHLLMALDSALSTPLTLLSASAGLGKTTLLSVWARRQKAQVAWLSLGELDNSPTHFWVALITALRCCPDLAANFGADVVAQLQSPQPPPLTSCLSVLLHELEHVPPYPAPLVLILDDYQVIEEQAIHQSLTFFLHHVPSHLHLILSSRVDPDLSLARLRAQGQLTEIRADELRFQEGETRQFLDQMLSPSLSQAEVQRLLDRTEGWIAGLHLVSLALQKREDRSSYLATLTGSHRYLLDYVQEDILASLPLAVRDFLLHTAILLRLDAAVCQSVTALPTRAASQQMLTFLERANLFLVPLDEERHTYRWHDLFREALLSSLHTSQPEMEPVLHRRAAHFYAAAEEWAEAITHALAASDYALAARLLEQTVAQFWLRGESETMARWVLQLPESTVHEHTHLLLTTALYRLHTLGQTTEAQRESVHHQVRQLISRVEHSFQASVTVPAHPLASPGAPSLAEDALLYRRLRLLRAGLGMHEALSTFDVERLTVLHQEMQGLDQDEEAIWHLLPLTCSFILHYRVWKDSAKLLPQLLLTKERIRLSGSLFATVRVGHWLSLSALEAGQLRLAYHESLATLELIAQLPGYALLKNYLATTRVSVLYQWHRLSEAREVLHTVIHDSTTWQQSDVLLSGFIHLLQVELSLGDLPAVDQLFHQFAQFSAHTGYASYQRWLPALQAQRWLAQGQVSVASDWATGLVFPPEAWDASLYYTFQVRIRVYFAQQRWAEAASLLDNFHDHLDRPTNIMSTLIYLAQLLVALYHTGDLEQASLVATRLLALTAPEGYLRVYLDEGAPMSETLKALFAPLSQSQELAPSTRDALAKLLAVFEHERQGSVISLASPTSESALASRQPVVSSPGAALTPREQEVLQLLSTGASNREIAQALVIELPTVKKHVSNVLGKLQASSRTQAISRARALSLL